MKNPFILNKLSQGILQKKASAEKAIVKQQLKSILLPGYNYKLSAQGRAKFTFTEDNKILWSNGLSGNSIILDSEEISFSPSCEISQLKVEMIEDEDQLFSTSIKEVQTNSNNEEVIEYEFIKNNDFMDRTERFINAEGVTPEAERGDKLRWIEGYNSYIVREVN